MAVASDAGTEISLEHNAIGVSLNATSPEDVGEAGATENVETAKGVVSNAAPTEANAEASGTRPP